MCKYRLLSTIFIVPFQFEIRKVLQLIQILDFNEIPTSHIIRPSCTPTNQSQNYLKFDLYIVTCSDGRVV